MATQLCLQACDALKYFFYGAKTGNSTGDLFLCKLSLVLFVSLHAWVFIFIVLLLLSLFHFTSLLLYIFLIFWISVIFSVVGWDDVT